MIVNWKKDCLCVVPIVDTRDKTGCRILGKTTLYPGYNQVSDDKVDVFKKAVKRYMDLGILEIVEVKKDGKTKDAKELKDVSPQKAEEIIEETNDPGTIKKWKNKESREDVRLNLKKREEEIEEYTTPKKPKKKGK